MEATFKFISETEYNKLNQKLDLIIQNLTHKERATSQGIDNWISEKEAQDITGKKATTLWKMRNNGLLAFTKFNNKVFYDRKSIQNLMEVNRKEAYRMSSASSPKSKKS